MSQAPNNSIDQIMRTTQIIMGALIASVTILLLIVVLLVHVVGFGAPAGAAAAPGQAAGPNLPARARSIPFMTYVTAGMGAIVLAMSFILPDVVGAHVLRSGGASPRDGSSSPTKSPTASSDQAVNPAAAFQLSCIVGGALNNGGVFLTAVPYLIEQNPIALVVALVFLAALVLRFPTRGRAERWIALQEEKLRSGAF